MRAKMLGVIVTANLIVFSMCSRAVAVDWSDPDWGYRTIITVDNNSNPNADLRKEVAIAFGKVRNEKAVPALEAVRVGDSEIEVRQEADAAIREIKKSGL